MYDIDNSRATTVPPLHSFTPVPTNIYNRITE